MAKIVPIDNVNVIRNGFFAPDFSLPDSEGHIFRLKDNLRDNFICLAFIPDGKNEKVIGLLRDLSAAQLKTGGGMPVRLVGISPLKSLLLGPIKENLGPAIALLSDQNLAVAKRYYIIAENAPRPTFYFSIFVIDDAGIVRIRMFEIAGVIRFDFGNLKQKITDLV